MQISVDSYFKRDLQERFLSYVKIVTTSDPEQAKDVCPSTPEQWTLLHVLKEELKNMGVEDIKLTEKGFLIATLPARGKKGSPCVGFMAHVDTSHDVSFKEVFPQVHENYAGGIIQLKENIFLDPNEESLLKKYLGDTIITSDGTSLLGADDKAGVAILMSVIQYLQANPEVEHPALQFFFTPDEETGRGMHSFPLELARCEFAYTLDGSTEGEIENECYTAYVASVMCRGIGMHPGTARGRMVNAISMATSFLSQLPRNESPEATDGYYGNFWPHSITGSLEESRFDIHMRDFSEEGMQRRKDILKAIATSIEYIYQGGKVDIKFTEQYRNMKEVIDQNPLIMKTLEEAVQASGVVPCIKPIRGGTDGSQLTAKGIPCPNIFTGGQNFHSKKEWVALGAMARSAESVLHLIQKL